MPLSSQQSYKTLMITLISTSSWADANKPRIYNEEKNKQYITVIITLGTSQMHKYNYYK